MPACEIKVLACGFGELVALVAVSTFSLMWTLGFQE